MCRSVFSVDNIQVDPFGQRAACRANPLIAQGIALVRGIQQANALQGQKHWEQHLHLVVLLHFQCVLLTCPLPKALPWASCCCPVGAFWVNCDIIPNIIHDKKMLKKHDKFLSTFPTNLEKKYVKNLYFHPFSPSLLVGSFVIWGF